MDSVMDIILDRFNEFEETSSLSDLFTFRESEKSLTMDSVDAGASFQASYAPASQHFKRAFNGEERHSPLTFKFQI
jgi:hypothetical protein